MEVRAGIEVLYEDNHILVAVKPPNIPSQADESHDPDMLSLVKEYVKERYHKPGNVFIGLVHRLDRPAGGLMVFARTSKAAARLSDQMRTGKFDKKYFAVTRGVPDPPEAELIGYLVKDGSTNTVRAASKEDPDTKKAVLAYRVLARRADSALVGIDLETGRPHQIRVQMADAGWPLLGDAKYGTEGRMTRRLALWSWHLSFDHPVRDERMTFKKAPPTEEPWSLPEYEAVSRSLCDNSPITP